MRKETTGRLLLSLLTAFIMVAGALGAALPTLTQDLEGDESAQRTVVNEAESELENKMGETGDAPVSANRAKGNKQQLEHSTLFDMPGMEPKRPRNPNSENEGIEIEEDKVGSTLDVNMPHGTRNPDSVSAGGPYGSEIPFAPYYEGEPITFTAEIEPEDEEENYQVRWDVDGDGQFDGPGDAGDEFFGEYGEMSMTHTFYDDYQGVATVEAWDGSWTTISYDGVVLDGEDGDGYGYAESNYGDYYVTYGWTFEVTEDVTVDSIANYRNYWLDPYGGFLALRIYDDTGTSIGEILSPPTPGGGIWAWTPLVPALDLYPGTTYTIAAYAYDYWGWGWFPTITDAEMPDESADGVVITGDPVYSLGDTYPTTEPLYGWYGKYACLDFHYTYEDAYPNVLSDTAKVLVWNRIPILSNPEVSPSSTREGEGDSWFTGEVTDLGLDDDLEYQWDFGDGTQSEWLPVPKHSGGVRLLFLHGCSTPGYGFFENAVPRILEVMGPNVAHWEEYDYEFRGHSAPPELDYLLQFDVIYHAGFSVGTTNLHGPLGDVLADANDAGVGVVQLANTFYNIPDYGTEGRWRDEQYELLEPADVLAGSSPSSWPMNWWYSHPITDGIFGTLTAASTLHIHDTYALSPWATLLGTYSAGPTALAYADEGHHGIPESGRIVAYNCYPFSHFQEGGTNSDHFIVVANALMWASQQPLAEELSPPYPLPPITHIYQDDHPVHKTPSDQVTPSVRVRDDDHCHDVILGDPIEYLEDFNGPWGTYGNNPPPGWTIKDITWDNNDWHRYYYSSLGSYNARVYYYPYELMDEELISEEIDITGYSTVNINWDQRFYGSTSYDHQIEIDYRLDGGPWINGYLDATSSYSNEFDLNFDVTTGGASTLEYRFHYTETGTYNYGYWIVGDTEVTSGATELFSEDWDGDWGTYGCLPPEGWTIIDNGVGFSPSWNTRDWHRYMFSASSPGGTGTYAARVYYDYSAGNDDWLISPSFDVSDPSYTAALLRFDTWFNTGWHETYGHILISVDGGVTWSNIDTYDYPTDVSGPQVYDISAMAIGHTNVQIAFQYIGWNDWYWYVDNFEFLAIPEIRHVYGMSDWLPGPPVTVMNVFPSIMIPEEIPRLVTENSGAITVEGVRITDPGHCRTENYFYRIDYQDGSDVTPWTKVDWGTSIIYEDFEASPGTWPWSPWIPASAYAATTIETAAAHDGLQGADQWCNGYDGFYYRTDVSIGNSGDVLSAWVQPLGVWPRTYLGFAADSVGCYTFTIGPNGNQIEIQDCSPYGSFTTLASTPFSFTDNHWYRAEIEFVSTTEVIGRLYDDDGTTLLAEVTASASFGLPGGIAHRGFYFYMDTLDNGAGGIQMEIPAWTVDYKDNGIYYTDVQIIDDDMYWDTSGPQPVWDGPAGEDPEDWIAHNYVDIEVQNVDPVISPIIRAYAQLDLRLRMSGTKTHTAEMWLYEDGDIIGYDDVTREPGAPNIGVISNVELSVTKDHEYMVYIEVDPNGGGGSNPTWIFDLVFPDGKFKEFKHTFNDEHGWTWTITDSMLKGALLGHDIIFEATADDIGSDDLAFVWNYGDSTPYGIHLFANVDQGTAVDAVSDEATVLFDQLPGRDADFTKAANDVRTPLGESISASDSISHVFDDDQAYYYYVMLLVMDDDIGDDYPSTQLHPCPGCDMAFVEIDFR
jgi:hypothetical protein